MRQKDIDILRDLAYKKAEIAALVITSYSIHYTKLYESDYSGTGNS